MRRFFTDRTPPTALRLREMYDGLAPNWQRGAGRLETWLAGKEMRNELTSRLHGDVLEVGIGAGDTVLRLAEQGSDVTSFTGIDQSPGMVEQTRKSAAALSIPVDLRTANAEDLSMFADDSFDTVTASMLLCTVVDVPKALSEFARVCKPKGRLVLIEHVLSPHRPVAALQRIWAPWQIRAIGCHIDRPTDQTLVECGYRIVEHRRRLFGVVRFIVAEPPR